MESDNAHSDNICDTHANSAPKAIVAHEPIEHAPALTISSHSLVNGNVTMSLYIYSAYRGPGAS